MNKTAILFAALAAASAGYAQEPASSYSVTTDFTYTSDYIFRGQKLADDSLQGSIEATFQNFYVGAWSSQPVKRHQENEIDLYGGYKYKMNEQLEFEAVGTYYWYPEAGGQSLKHSEELGVGGTYSLRGITTSVYYYYDFKLETETVQGSVGYSLPLEAIGASLDITGYYGVVDADDVSPWEALKTHESYNYYGIDVAVPYKLSEHATFTLGAHWSQGKNMPSDVDDDHLWWSAGLTVGF